MFDYSNLVSTHKFSTAPRSPGVLTARVPNEAIKLELEDPCRDGKGSFHCQGGAKLALLALRQVVGQIRRARHEDKEVADALSATGGVEWLHWRAVPAEGSLNVAPLRAALPMGHAANVVLRRQLGGHRYALAWCCLEKRKKNKISSVVEVCFLASCLQVGQRSQTPCYLKFWAPVCVRAEHF